jgi:uncharacterized protein (DUF885 family)
MSARKVFVPILFALLIVAGGIYLHTAAAHRKTESNRGPNDNLDARREQLKRLIADEWEFELRESPEQATQIGDYRYNDRWTDYSLAHVPLARSESEKFLAAIQAVDTSAFPEQEKFDQILMVRNLKDRLEVVDKKLYLMPVNQFSGVHISMPQQIAIVPLDSTRHYEDYLNRLHGIPRVLADLTGVLQQGEKDGLMPPAFLLQEVAAQCRSIAEPAGEANAWGQPVAKFADSISTADRQRLHDAILAAVDNEVRPAYAKFADFIATGYAPKGRKDPGIWALPNGDQLYRLFIHLLTTTDKDPEAIHQLGLSEVKRIEGEQLAIAKSLGFSDLIAFRVALKTNPKLIPQSREQILEKYRFYIAQMQPQLPKLFGLLPKVRLEVRPVESFREKEAAGAEYSDGTPDGSRPGIVFVNTSDYQHRSLTSIESTAYHEGDPGHHMQGSIAQEIPTLPAFRQEASYGAYVEGWALYSERLGKEIGFYQDPYSDYGRLSDEMLRAVRLVLDTGVHYKHWTRQQMIDFFHEHTSNDEPDLQAETDRYIAIPGQALCYKLGQLDILRLRKLAQDQLGAKFNIRAFHDEILDGGALPLDVLDARVTSWIAMQKSGNATSGH